MTQTPLLRASLSILASLLATVVACTVLPLGAASAAGPDDYADYDPQTTCASAAKPGTVYLLRWLIRQHPDTRYTGTLRSCSSGSGSEHKDGRALDWGADFNDKSESAQVSAMLKRLFATDRQGNRHALARRMGIMYLIWNNRIYSSYRGFAAREYSSCSAPSKCSKTMLHRDHVHISLSRSGAAAQSTFYRNRGVPSEPVLLPGTRRLDPESTAIVEIDVPADGRTVTTDFRLTRGTRYRIVGDGMYRYGPGARVGDAACRWSVRRNRWVPSDHGLQVNGTNPWGDSCGDGHTHSATYRAPRTSFLRLHIDDNTPRANSGSARFFILREDVATHSVATPVAASTAAPRPARAAGARARALVRGSVDVRAASARGVRTRKALRKGARYRVIVTGVAKSAGTRFDGNCVAYARRMRPQHSFDLTRPGADHLSLYLQGVRLNLQVPGARSACDGRTHRYVGRFKAVVGGRANFRVWDPYSYADNSGSLRVKIRRL